MPFLKQWVNEKVLRTSQPPPFIPLHHWARVYFNVSLEKEVWSKALNEEQRIKLKAKLSFFSEVKLFGIFLVC